MFVGINFILILLYHNIDHKKTLFYINQMYDIMKINKKGSSEIFVGNINETKN
jgi:hypothetical protein